KMIVTGVQTCAIPILSGFVNNETDASLRNAGALSGSAGLTGAATAAINASATTYTITPTAGNLTATNYDFTSFQNGALTINKVQIGRAAGREREKYEG